MTGEAWRAYLIVEESDGPGWTLHEAHPTLERAITSAEAWKTRDRSHGGRPYTWVHIIEQAGADVEHDWVFDDWTATWVSADRGTRTTTVEQAAAATVRAFDDGHVEVERFALHHSAGLTPETEAIIERAVER